MQRVFVIDSQKQPLMPCEPAKARKLLKAGKAAVFRRYPFTIILKERVGGDVQPVQVKLDPGSKHTGVALVSDTKRGKRVVWAGEIQHRGGTIRDALLARRGIRRGRRNRNTRYREARFDNRRRAQGWLPPSLMSRIHNISTWCGRLYRFAPVAAISMELVKFDTQIMQNAEISGVEYQQGELAGYEVREYLLEKWGRKCAYCGAKDTALEIEHIIPKSRGGSNRVSNLTLACHDCNQTKGAQTAAEFGHPEIQKQAKLSLKDAAAMNATRWALYRRLVATGLPVEVGTGGRTKYNRVHQDYPKAHWIDAACVGMSGERVYITPRHAPLMIKAMGWGNRQMMQSDKYGFPRQYRSRQKYHFGFQTGDMVRVTKPNGVVVARVTCRADGRFYIQKGKVRFNFTHRICTAIHRADGYSYQ